MTVIAPTVGRIVHYRPEKNEGARMIHNGDEPLSAQIAKVNSPNDINLAVLGADGVWHARANVPLVQEGEEPPTDRSYAEWMPFQQGQAAKTEAAEAKLAAAGAAGSGAPTGSGGGDAGDDGEGEGDAAGDGEATSGKHSRKKR